MSKYSLILFLFSGFCLVRPGKFCNWTKVFQRFSFTNLIADEHNQVENNIKAEVIPHTDSTGFSSLVILEKF